MCADAVAEEHSSSVLIPPVQFTAPEDVQNVIPLPGYRIAVRFMDGVSGLVDLSALVVSPEAGVFEQLKDPEIFNQVRIEYGAVTWPGEIDLAPDAMHDELAARGEWVLC
jgi:hypothetical protein